MFPIMYVSMFGVLLKQIEQKSKVFSAKIKHNSGIAAKAVWFVLATPQPNSRVNIDELEDWQRD